MVDTYGQAGTWARDRNDLWLDTFLAAISGYGDLIPECGQLASAPYIWDLIAATSGDSPVITVRLPFEDMFVLPVFGARGNEIPSTYRVNACMWPGRPDWYIDDRIRPGGIIPENELL